jgi:hypothetical protein
MGTGRIDLTQGALIGLVMDETVENYEHANPYEGGEPKTLNQPSMVDHECVNECSWTRTVRSVLDAPVTYNVVTEAPEGMLITVTPNSFSIAPGATQELVIDVDVDLGVLPSGDWAFAQVHLEAETANQLNTVLLEESFEDITFPPTDWTVYNLDGATPQWERTTAYSHSGDASARHSYSTSVDQNGWLVTPALDIQPNTLLSFYDLGAFMSWYVYRASRSPPAVVIPTTASL